MADPITTLSLCSGVGWLDEAVGAGCRHFGWEHRVACYCEWESYAASVLLARMAEASLEPAPIWCGDLGDFDGKAFRGSVDGIVAGFPCQPWSNAGKQLGTDDDRWLWPAIVRVIDDVEPGFLFLENVSALITGGGLEYVLSDLAARGFNAEWCCLTAEAVGAAHRRERVFALAYRAGERFGEAWCAGGEFGTTDVPRFDDTELGDSASTGATAGKQRGRLSGHQFAGAAVADAIKPELQQASTGGSRFARGTVAASAGGDVAQPAGEGSQGIGKHNGAARRQDATRPTGLRGGELFAPGPRDFDGWDRVVADGSFDFRAPAVKPGVRVLVDGVTLVVDTSRADQLRCGGNGVVALQGAVAFVELVRRSMTSR